MAGVRSLLVEAGDATLLDDLFAAAGPATGHGSTVLRLQCAGAVVDFLRDHADDFRRLPLEAVEALAAHIFPALERQPGFPSLLIKTCNALGAREDAGDRRCAALRDALDSQLRAIAGGGRKPARSSRRRS